MFVHHLKTTKLFLYSLIIYSSLTLTNFQDQFCTLFLPCKPTHFYFADHSKIELKNQSSYLLFTMTWQQKITKGFIQFFSKIQDELDISIEQLYELYTSEKITRDFNTYQRQKISKIYSDSQTILEEDMDTNFLSFLQESLQKYSSIHIKDIQLVISPHISSIAEVCYDATEQKYIVILNSLIYNLKYFNKITNTSPLNPIYFHRPNKEGTVDIIDYNTLLQSGFIMAASVLHHQFNLLMFIVANYKFYGAQVSDETILLLSRLMSMQLDLEIILQSNNPLEVAHFCKKLDLFPDNQKHWKQIIQDLEKMYDDKSLEKFKNIFLN